MPVIVHSLNQIADENIKSQIIKIYQHTHEFTDGEQAYQALEQAVEQDTQFYVAIFNDKIIASIWSAGTGDSRLLKHIVVHPANRGRGIAERLISEVCRLEEEKGVQHFQPYCPAIRKTLIKLGKWSES